MLAAAACFRAPKAMPWSDFKSQMIDTWAASDPDYDPSAPTGWQIDGQDRSPDPAGTIGDRGGSRVRILLCDSHRLLVEALAASLRRGGHDVVAVTTLPEEALDAAVEHDPDVCLLDVIFPGAPGSRPSQASGRPHVRRCWCCRPDATRTPSAPRSRQARAGSSGRTRAFDDILRSLDQVCAGEVIMPAETSSTPSRGPGRPHTPELAALRFLTSREREALRLIAEGESTKEIAQSMHVAYSTARTHVQNVLTKLGVARAAAAALVPG